MERLCTMCMHGVTVDGIHAMRCPTCLDVYCRHMWIEHKRECSIDVRFSHNQIGTLVEVRKPNQEWQTVDLYKHTAMDVTRTENFFLAHLKHNHINYKVVRGE